ncbi:MAG: ATP phosphoribosyltransferase regulatory subunit [Pseudomonadota bacterium]
MADAAAIRAEMAALVEGFEALGAARVEAAMLQPADTLLDLYGENIRARAYVTQDPLRGEQMLRPDFTVPVAQMHMRIAAEPAAYTYAGPVFRRQEVDAGRPNEYPQVGYELFDRGETARVDAALFAAFHNALAGLALKPVVGDIGILSAAVKALDTTEARKAALLRHLWRPARFRDLLDRFTTPVARGEAPEGGPEIGLRSAADVARRLDRIAEDEAAAPLDADLRAGLERLLDIKGPAPQALAALREMDMAGIAPALDRFEARTRAIAGHGIDVDALMFEVSYGRTSMEYYDGFVFGFSASGLPPVASGGRYDALTRALSSGEGVPAVGGVIRPDLVAALKEAGA